MQAVAVLGARLTAVLPGPRWKGGNPQPPSPSLVLSTQEEGSQYPGIPAKSKESCKKPLFKPSMYTPASWWPSEIICPWKQSSEDGPCPG